jgi:2-polyprenyl-3-methyl-5-hydroxy-6-metoxy-1,4-benzoquinol methylase
LTNKEHEYINSFIIRKDSPVWETRLRDILNRGYSSCKLLDIGCNFGFFLSVCEPHFDTYGLDISDHAISLAHKYTPGSKLTCHDVEQSLPFAEGTFDVVTAWDTIEHITNCGSLLREVRRVLKYRGLFVLSTPNRWSMNSLLFGKDYWFKADRSHVTLYSRRTINENLLKEGFSHIEIRTINNVHFLGVLYDKYKARFASGNKRPDIVQGKQIDRLPTPVIRRYGKFISWLRDLKTPWGANLYVFAINERV